MPKKVYRHPIKIKLSVPWHRNGCWVDFAKMILESFSFSPCELSRSQCHLLQIPSLICYYFEFVWILQYFHRNPKDPWGWTSNHLCPSAIFRYEIRSTTVLFLQLCYSTFLMFFVSQKILNCFMTVWTELCRFFNTCKCYFFFDHSSMVHPTFNTNFWDLLCVT